MFLNNVMVKIPRGAQSRGMKDELVNIELLLLLGMSAKCKMQTRLRRFLHKKNPTKISHCQLLELLTCRKDILDMLG